MISTRPVLQISVLGVWGDAARQPPPLGCAPERKYWIHNVSRASEQERELHIQFGRLKNVAQKFFKYFRMSISKFENLKQLLPTDKRRIYDGDVA
jgi:predicted DNA-binding WGR domain protein